MGVLVVTSTGIPKANDTDRPFLLLCLLVPLAVLILFFVYPLATVVVHSVTEPDGRIGFGNYATVIVQPNFWNATANSLLMSMATTAVSLVLGLTIAFSTQRCRIPGRSLMLHRR